MPTTNSLTVRTAERPGGSRPSEDRIFQADNAVIVLDGATQALALERTGGWIAEETGQRLIAGLTAQPNVDLRELLKTCIVGLVDDHGLKPGMSPSTTVSIARFNKTVVDILVLCDSPVILLNTNGSIIEVRDDRLSRISSSLHRPDGPRDMSKPEWVEQITTFETYRNRPGGFWCVSASPEAADEAIVKQFSVSDCQAIMLMTDGVSAIVDDYQSLPSWQAAMNVGRTDPEQLVALVHDTELHDPAAEKWPRGKVHDDKALAVVDLSADVNEVLCTGALRHRRTERPR